MTPTTLRLLRLLLVAALWVAACGPQVERDGGAADDFPAAVDADGATPPPDGFDVAPMPDVLGGADRFAPPDSDASDATNEPATDRPVPPDALPDAPPPDALSPRDAPADVAADATFDASEGARSDAPSDAAPDLPSPPDAPVDAPADASAPSDVPLNASCLAATPVPPGSDVQLTASIRDATERIGLCGSTVVVGSGVRFYRATVMPGQMIEVSVLAREHQPLLQLYADCALRACLAYHGTSDSSNFLLRWRNPEAAPRDVILVVSWSAAMPTRPTLSFRVRYREPGANVSCAAAIRLTPGETLAGQELLDTTTNIPNCPDFSTAFMDGLWYRATVPPGQTLTVTTVADGIDAGATLVLYPSCAPTSCLATQAAAAVARTFVTRWSNPDAVAREVMIAATSSRSGSLAPRFAITATLSPAPPNLTCDRAIEVAGGAVLRAQDVTGASTFHAACPGVSLPETPVLFYRTTVPPGQALYADVTSAAPAPTGLRYMLRVAPDCSLAACLASSHPYGGPVQATWANLGATARPVILTLGADPSAAASPLDLAVRFASPPANASCAAAQRVMDGTRLTVGTFRDARDLVGACPAVQAGPTFYYAVRLGAGQQLVATSEAVGQATAAPIRLVDACAGAACLAASTVTSPGPPNLARLTFTNTGAARELLLLLAPPPAAVGIAATLTVAISP